MNDKNLPVKVSKQDLRSLLDIADGRTLKKEFTPEVLQQLSWTSDDYTNWRGYLPAKKSREVYLALGLIS